MIWVWIVVIVNFTELITIFTFPNNFYDIEYTVLKATVNVINVVLFYMTYRYLSILKRTGYILNICLIFASVFLFSIKFALSGYYTSFSNRYEISFAFGCFVLMFIPSVLIWSLPNFIYFYKRRAMFSVNGIANVSDVQSVYTFVTGLNNKEIEEDEIEIIRPNIIKSENTSFMSTSLNNGEKQKIEEYATATVGNKSIELEQEIAFCRKCGTQLLNDSEFCHKCGCEKVH